MSVITGSAYLEVSNYYSNAYEATSGSQIYLFDAVYTIAMLEQTIPEVDLLAAFYDAYQVNTSPLSSTSLLLNAVRTINNHVLTRGNYSTLDLYLEAENIKVSATWALLSANAGYAISSSNIA